MKILLIYYLIVSLLSFIAYIGFILTIYNRMKYHLKQGHKAKTNNTSLIYLLLISILSFIPLIRFIWFVIPFQMDTVIESVDSLFE